MEYVEKKIDTLLRRVSSKTRRALRRTRRVTRDSSSGSEFEDSSSQSLTPKCERKSIANTTTTTTTSGTGRRCLQQKTCSNSKLNKSNVVLSSETPAAAAVYRETIFSTNKFTIQRNQISYFHLWLVVWLFRLQNALLTLIRLRNSSKNRPTYCTDEQSTTTIQHRTAIGQNTAIRSSSLDGYHERNLPTSNDTSVVYSTDQETPSSRSNYKSCESEDADYVSDHSIYSRPRKSINELDMSMDESLADSVGRESGYLSGIDLSFINRGSPSSGESPALSPRGFSFGRERALLIGRPLKLRTPFTERLLSDATRWKHDQLLSESILCIAHPLQEHQQQQQQHKEEEDDDAAIPDYKSTETMLQSCVTETKYVTAIFEVTSGGIVGIIDDVINEFNMWFNAQIGLMGIACEIHWSCPKKHRNRAIERRLKEALHWSLRENNRRILNLKNRSGVGLPLTLVASDTEENIQSNERLDCFQGVYRRFYTSLLAFQHAETSEWHKPYWSMKNTNGKYRQPVEPNLQQFICGNQPTQLDTGSLVAINIVALRVSF